MEENTSRENEKPKSTHSCTQILPSLKQKLFASPTHERRGRKVCTKRRERMTRKRDMKEEELSSRNQSCTLGHSRVFHLDLARNVREEQGEQE